MHTLLRFFFPWLSCLCIAFASNGQALDSTMWVTDGTVFAIARDSNTIYLGGSFSNVYPNTGGGAVVNLSDGKLSNPNRFPYINGFVRVVVPDGKGGWYIGGNFTMVQGVARFGLAHILADHTLDLGWDFGLVPGREDGNLYMGVYCMVRFGNTLYVGGNFSKLGGHARTHVGAIDLATGQVVDWAPVILSSSSFVVMALAVTDTGVYIGGNFYSVNGVARRHLAAVDAGNASLLPFDPQPDGDIWSLLSTEGVVYAGGRFTNIGGQTRKYLAALHPANGAATSWSAYVGDTWSTRDKLTVTALALHNGVLYAGGELATDLAYNTFRAIDVATGQNLWYKKVNGHVSHLLVHNNTLYLGGTFTKVDYGVLYQDPTVQEGSARTNLASVDLATKQITGWTPDPGGSILSFSIDGDQLYLGGSGLRLNGQKRQKLAAFDAMTGAVTDWVPQIALQGYVKTLAVSGNVVFAGGGFKSPDHPRVKNLVAVEKKTGRLTPWRMEADSTVKALAMEKDLVFVGGDFNQVGGLPRGKLAAVNALTGQVTDWAPVVSGSVQALAVRNGMLYAGGNFTRVNNQPRNYVAGISTANAQPSAWNANIETSYMGSVSAITIHGRYLYMVGSFFKVGGKERSRLAAVDAGSGQVADWNPNTESTSNGEFHTLSAYQRTIYVGGRTFGLSNERVMGGLAGVDAITGKVTWNPGLQDYSETFAIAVHKGAIYAGGDFSWLGDPFKYPKKARSINNFAAFGPKINASANLIAGSIFNDVDRNCTKSETEQGLGDLIVTAEPGPYYGITDSLGNYTLAVDTGTYTVRQVLPQDRGQLITQSCPASPTAHTISFKGYNNTVTGKDFGNQVTLLPYLTTSVASTRRRRCFRANTTISYCNAGSLPVADAKVHLELPAHVVLIRAGAPYTVAPDKHLVFNVGTLAPDQCGTIQLTDSVVCDNPDIRGLTQCTKVWITPANATAPGPGWDQSDVTLKANCISNGRVRLGLYNTGTGAMTDSSAYRLYLDAKLVLRRNFKLAASDSLMLQVTANGQTVRLEADQRPGHPTRQSTSVSLEGCGTNAGGKVSLGFVAQLPQDDAEPEVDTECLPITDSFDPNDKLVLPAGVTAEHYTAFGQELEYTVRFQNTGNDYAYRVVVVDTLSDRLDVSTLRVVGATHPYKFTVSGKGRPVLSFTFDNINLPDSSRDQAGSNGLVKFTVKSLAGLPDKTRIENFADIFFDYNPPVRTNTVLNTLHDLPLEVPGGDALPVTFCAPNQPVSAGDNQAFCGNQTTVLRAQNPAHGQGRWKRISGAGRIEQPHDPHTAVSGLGTGDNVFEWSIADGSCATDSLRSRVTVTRFPNPEKPVIAFVGVNGLQSSVEGDSYQWYCDNLPLAGNGRRIEADRAGAYTVQVANGSCSSELSDPLDFRLTSPVLKVLSRIYPNPAGRKFTVALPAGVAWVQISIVDAQGKKVAESTAHHPGREPLLREFNLVACRAGVYLVKIQTRDAVVVKRVVLR
jgi:uncharacterized repeat protein (TIGR01451 family)